VKPATIATKLVAKYGASYARGLAHGRMKLNLYATLDSTKIHRAIVWMTVGQLIDKVGNAAVWDA
jgi:hypothetical protein